jgi:SAM-dependent methyltransferase
MQYEWTQDKIEYFIRASIHTGFHRWLASAVRPFLKPDDNIVDIGCGIGRIDLELAKDVRSITAIDENPDAIRQLKENATKLHIENILTEVKDAGKIRDNSWDVTLLSFFGEPGDGLQELISKTGRCSILITHIESYHPSPALPPHNSVRKIYAGEMEIFFEKVGMSWQKQILTLEFGQPLKSLDDARHFIEIYTVQTDPEARRQHMERTLPRLVKTAHPEYPYYLPKDKHIAIYTIEK